MAILGDICRGNKELEMLLILYNFISMCVEVISAYLFFLFCGTCRMHQMKLPLSCRVFQISSLAITAMEILLPLCYPTNLESHRFTVLNLHFL